MVSLKREDDMAQHNALEDRALPDAADTGAKASAMGYASETIFDGDEEVLILDDQDAQQPLLTIARAVLICAAIGWISFALWLFARRNFAVPDADQIPYVITLISIPLILFAVLYQLLLRSSIGEATRFTRITQQLRKEGQALDLRLAIVNQQLDTARQTMREQASLLEQYGASASLNLESAAQKLSIHAQDSAQQAESIERAGQSLASHFADLINTMPAVEERAERVSSALTLGSASLGEKVDKLESRLDSMVTLLEETRARTMNATQSLVAQLVQIQDASRSATDEMNGMADISASRIAASVEDAQKALGATGTTLDTQMSDLSHLVERSRTIFDEIGTQTIRTYSDNISLIEKRLRDLEHMVGDQNNLIAGIGDELTNRIDRVSNRFHQFEQQGVSGAERLSSALDQLTRNTSQLDQALQAGNQTAEAVIARSESLLLALDASVRELDEGHPAALARLDDRIDQSRRLLLTVTPEVERLEAISSAVLGQAREAGDLLSGQGEKLTTLLQSNERGLFASREQVQALHQAIEATDKDAQRLSDSAGPQLVATLLRIRESADQAGERARQALSRAIADATDELGEASEQALNQRFGERFQERMEEISAVADRAVQAAHVASDRLMRQLLTIADTTASIEKRVAEADNAAQQRDKENFSNSSAILIESLNSISIDVTRLLSQEVSDTSWTAYLKGDRGVFTRRAVALLSNGEARSIGQLYDDDATFRDNVNRYIHDFEAMLRTVLSARDGSSLGVTLLSSDIGKLYVALAQAIDRLRN